MVVEVGHRREGRTNQFRGIGLIVAAFSTYSIEKLSAQGKIRDQVYCERETAMLCLGSVPSSWRGTYDYSWFQSSPPMSRYSDGPLTPSSKPQSHFAPGATIIFNPSKLTAIERHPHTLPDLTHIPYAPSLPSSSC